MKRKLMLLLTCLFVGIGLVTAQNQKVTGVVLSEEDGQPVIGASVLVKGTTMGTSTDMDGKFTLSNIPSSAKVLVVSYIGMKKSEVAIKPNLRITLVSDAKVIDEVMVVAYGVTKKASFTGSASSIKAEDVSSQKESLVKSLQGKVAGVRIGGSTGDPGSDQKILIRGISSISASSQPLYVIDGVPVVNNDVTSGLKSQSVLSSINPDDIESLTVLKDAAAASLYGSRAANGVIIVTTKKGKEGKTKVSYNMETGWTQMAVGGQYTPMSASDLKDYYYEGRKNNYIVVKGKSEADAITAANAITPSMFKNYNSDINTNWKDEVYRKGFITDHQVAISGGNDKTKIYTGFGYNKTEGLIKGSEFKRYSGRINVDHQAYNWLRISARQSVSFTNTEGFRDQNDQAQGLGTSSPLSILFSMDPTAVNKLEDGSYNPNASFSTKISNPNLMLGQSTGTNAETVSSETMRSMTNFEAEVTLPYGFSAKSVFGYDYMDNKEREFWAPGSVNGQSLKGLGVRYDYTNKTMTSSSTINYLRNFGKHNVRALAGFEVEDRSLLYTYASAKSYSTDKLPELANGQPYESSSSISESSIMSWLGNVNYDYDNKYYLSASFRRDGSSRLGVDNRWANFWSVSGAWRISSEEFLQGNDLFSDLKLRASYGTNGNLPSDYYANLATYSFSGGYGDESAIYWGNAGNTKLGWEKSKNFNIGVDWSLYNRVNVSLEYYNKLTTDLLFEVPTSILTGFSSNWQNLGKVKNSGVEFSLNSTNIVTKDFSWSTSLNLTKQSNKVKKLPEGNDVMYGDGNMYLLREGESMHTFYLPEWLGVNSQTGLGEFYIDPSLKSRDKVVNGQAVTDGNVTNYYSKAGKTNVGKALPDWLGGITNTFTYKNFDLSFMVSFQTGARLFDYPGYFLTYSDGVRMGSFGVSEEVAGNYWKKAGDKVDFPKPIFQNPYRSDKFSSRTIKSTDNIRMRDITFGYKVPVSKKYISNLRLFFKANNPFMIYCATDNIDPDVDINGYRQVDTPPTKSFMFGFNIEL
jgi:TonB-linked SusC/RagA family outer membrane protein